MVEMGRFAGDVATARIRDSLCHAAGQRRRAFHWKDRNGNGWSDAGEMIALRTLGFTASEALDINEAGQVVGFRGK